MTGSNRSSAGLDARRRRILFRAWHRGTREMDLIMGQFADAWLGELTEAELDQFEALIAAPDRELYAWITGEEAAPRECATTLFDRLRDFHLQRTIAT